MAVLLSGAICCAGSGQLCTITFNSAARLLPCTNCKTISVQTQQCCSLLPCLLPAQLHFLQLCQGCLFPYAAANTVRSRSPERLQPGPPSLCRVKRQLLALKSGRWRLGDTLWPPELR